MTLAAFSDEDEALLVGRTAKDADIFGFWTGGFFDDDSGDWVWQQRPVPAAAFSAGGMLTSQGQPDNFMGKVTGGLVSERCLAVLNNWFNDGFHRLHDFVCHERLPFICKGR